MLQRLSQCRRKYGDVYVTVLEDGTEIPWRPLTIKEFMEYEVQFQSGRYPSAVLEDEIFRLCVLDKFFVDTVDEQVAGTVSIVATNILAQSGPHKLEDFNAALQVARLTMRHPLHHAAETISRAFPAYKPEDIYAMDFDTFMLRLAMSEERLLSVGILKEPLELISGDASQQPVKKKVDATELALKLADLNKVDTLHPALERPLPKKSNRTIISATDELESTLSLSGHEKQDIDILKAEALKGIESIYPEYFAMMKKGEKISPEKIKTPDERAASYKERIQAIKAGRSRPAITRETKPPERPKSRIKRR